MPQINHGNNNVINNILKKLGNLAMIAALFFIIIKLFSYDVDYSEYLNTAAFFYISIAIIIYAGCILFSSVPWARILEAITNKKITFMEVAAVSSKANIMKYIPGNIFQYLGRNELAIQQGFKHSDVAVSTLIDVFWNVFTLGSISIILYGNSIKDWINYYGKTGCSTKIPIWVIVILALAAISIFILIKINPKGVISKYKKLCSKKFIIIMLQNYFLYAFIGLINTLITIGLFFVINPIEISYYSITTCCGAILVSWLIGFITPGAPGGLGVREIVMVFLMQSLFNKELILFVVVINRMISIIGDLLAFLIGRIIAYRIKK